MIRQCEVVPVQALALPNGAYWIKGDGILMPVPADELYWEEDRALTDAIAQTGLIKEWVDERYDRLIDRQDLLQRAPPVTD